ncbi:hypothetical protein MMC29_001837 [Sticta canariensis]|nr:hypothetical protein [Sticta canariensis]
MERIPNELLTKICSHLDNGDIVKLPFHIISRAFSPKELKQRFRHLRICLSKHRLEGLVQFAAKRGLREIVTKMTIITSVERPKLMKAEEFLQHAWSVHETRKLSLIRRHEDTAVTRRLKPEVVDFDNFHSIMGQAESSCHYCHDMSLVEQFDRYERAFRAWLRWHNKKYDVSLLKVAFALLPNLQTVRIDDNVELEKEPHVNDSLSFYAERYEHPAFALCGTNALAKIVEAVSDSQMMRPTFRNMRNSRPSIYGKDVIYLMLGNLVLTVADSSLHMMLTDRLERLELTNVFSTQSGLFHRGTISISSIDACIPIVFSNFHFPNVYRILQDLRTLKIHGWNSGWFPLDATFLPSVPRYLLSLLSSLDLQGFETQEGRLFYFLALVASTLKNLRLCNITLTRGTWVTLFDRVGGRFDLDVLRFEDLKNRGEELVEMTGSPVTVILVLTQLAMANLFDWMCGAADVHYTRVLMCPTNMSDIEEEIRHRDIVLAAPQETRPDLITTSYFNC